MSPDSRHQVAPSPFKINNTLCFIILLAVALVFLGIGKIFHLNAPAVKAYLSGLPLLASGLLFVLIYVVSTFFVWIGPKDILRIAAAAVYGPYVSTVLVWLGEMGNVLTMFSLSRRMGRGYVERRISGKALKLDQVISETGFLSIFFLRAFPIVPFRFLDLGFGLTRISFKKYFLICALGSPPRIFFLQFFLALGMDIILDQQRLQDYLTAHPGVWWVSSIYTLAALGTVVWMKRSSRKGGAGVTSSSTGKG